MAQFDSNFHDMTEGIRAVASPADAAGLLNTIVEGYGLETAAFLTVRPVYEEPSQPFYVTTYSPDWVKRYIEKDFFEIDPVLPYGLRAVTLVDWKEI
ncbi:autoinducer binding domain-containing protein, partial [Mesorhizobium sp. M0643]